MSNDYLVMNTFFHKESPQHYCTYKEPSADQFKEPWTPTRFAAVDFCLAPKRWRNNILDVSAMPTIAINTDHALVKTILRIKLRGEIKDKEENVARYRKPTEEEEEQYNTFIWEAMNKRQEEHWNKDKQFEEFTKAMHAAAQTHLTEISPEQRKNYISKETWDLIKGRQTQRQLGEAEKEKGLQSNHRGNIHGW